MDVRYLTIEVRSGALGRIGQIDLRLVTDLVITKRFNNVGSWTMTLPAEDPMSMELQKTGRGMSVTYSAPGKPDFILTSGRTLNWELTQNGSDPTGMVAFTGVDDMVHLSDALAWPLPTQGDVTQQTDAYDVRTGIGETIMREYVSFNIGPDAQASRRINTIQLQGDQERGGVVTGRARFDQLGLLLSQIGSVAGLGFDLIQNGEHLEFTVYEPTDKSDVVQMDILNDTLNEVKQGVAAPTATRAIVAGQGQGDQRQFIEYTDADATEAEADWGRIIEYFKDRRDTDDLDELEQEGSDIVTGSGRTIYSLSVKPSDDQTMIYGEDWFLGDIVAVVINGQTLHSTVTEAVIAINAAGIQVGATIGNPAGFDYQAQLIEKQQDVQTRLAFLEKNAEASTDFYPKDQTYTKDETDAVIAAADAALQTTLEDEIDTVHLPGTVDPLWTYGTPKVVLADTSVVQTIGWTAEGGYQPKPGENVLVSRSNGLWYITGPIESSPLFLNQIPLSFQNGWANYDGNWQPGGFSKTSDGIVALSGLVKPPTASTNTKAVIFNLPVGFRPDYDLIFDVNASDTWRSIIVKANGDVQLLTDNGASTNFANLDGICFPAAGVASWQSTGIAFANGFSEITSDARGNYGPVRYWKDDANGLVWWQGMLLHPTSATTDNTPMLTFPSSLEPENKEHHFASETNDAWGAVGIAGVNAFLSLNWKIGNQTSNTQLSLNRIVYPQKSQMSGFVFPTFSSWSQNTGQFTAAGYKKLANGMVYVQGFVIGGTVDTANKLWTQPAGTRPSWANTAHGAAGAMFNRPSNATTRARVLGDQNGAWSVEQGNNGWVSFDGILYIPRS